MIDEIKLLEALGDTTTRKLLKSFMVTPNTVANAIRITGVPPTSGFRKANWLKKNKLIRPFGERTETNGSGSTTMYWTDIRTLSVKVNGVEFGIWD